MNEITGCIDLPLKSSTLSMPKLDHWIELEVGGRMLISGVISRHPQYPCGIRILTSSIGGYTSDREARVFAVTKNSKYELGERMEVQVQDHLLSAIRSADALTAEGKQTIC